MFNNNSPVQANPTAPVRISWKAEGHVWFFFALTANDFSVAVALRLSGQRSFDLPVSCLNTDVEQKLHGGIALSLSF